MQNTIHFSVDAKGVETKEEYKGVFTAKTKLSLRESLREDQVRRELLGDTSKSPASEYAIKVATALAYLAIRITDAPGWWTDASNGLDLEDDNILGEVFQACVKEIDKVYVSQREAAEAARKNLKDSKDK